MRRSMFSICAFTICAWATTVTTAQVPDRVNDLVQQARGLAKSAQDSASNPPQTFQNPFSRDNTARSGIGISGATAGLRPGVDISDSAININVGGQSITVPRTGPNPIHPNSRGIGHNHFANPPHAAGGVTINGQPAGNCLLNKGVTIAPSGDVTIDSHGSTISTAAYRELAAGLEAFGRSDFSAAKVHLEKSVAANPADALLHPYYSLTLFADGNYDAAAEYAYSAAATTSTFWDWNQLRSFYADSSQYARQYEGLQLAARQAGATPSIHFLLAWHHLMLGHRESAQLELDRVLQQLPNDPVALGLLKLAEQPIIAPPEPLK